MKLTKYEHACFTIEAEGKLVVVDPGAFTTDLGTPENVVAIVVTHEHPDHFDVNALGALHLLGNGYRGVGLPDLIRDGRAAARELLAS